MASALQIGRASEVVLIACTSREQYLAALLAPPHAEPRAIPLLGSLDDCRLLGRQLGADVVEATHRVEERALAELAARLGDEPASPRLVVVLDDRSALFAAALALLSKRSLARVEASALLSWPGLRRAASVTVLAQPELLSAELIVGLGGVGRSVGVLSARSDEAMSRVVARSLLLSRRRVEQRFSVVKYQVEPSRRDDHSLVRWDDFGPAQAESLASDVHSVLSLTSHGDPIDLHLSGVVLCGRSSAAAPGQAASVVEHSCMASDLCPRNRGGAVPRLAIDRVQSEVIVAETCSGIALRDRIFPSALSLGLSALDGRACAYLSTTKVVRTTGVSALLASTLLTNGYPLGECARVVNAVHCQITGDLPSFLLVGDAEARFAARDDSLELKVELGVDGLVDVAFPSRFSGSLVRIELTGPYAERFARAAELFVRAEQIAPALPSDAEVFAVAVPGALDGALVVLLTGARRFELSSLRLRLTDAAPSLAALSSLLARVELRICQLSTLRDSLLPIEGAPSPPARQVCVEQLGCLVDESRAILNEGVATLNAAQNRATALPAPPLYESLGPYLHDRLAALDAGLARGFPSWGLTHYQVPLYGSLMAAAGPERAAGPCYRCGAPSFELAQKSHARPELARLFRHCPACDLLFDRLADEAPVEIHGQNPVASGSRATRELRIVNDRDVPRVFAASLHIEGDYPWLQVTFEPNALLFEVPPRTVFSVPFEVTVHASTAPGVYRLTAFTSSELSWSLSVEPFVVSRSAPKPIFPRRHGGVAGGMQRVD